MLAYLNILRCIPVVLLYPPLHRVVVVVIGFAPAAVEMDCMCWDRAFALGINNDLTKLGLLERSFRGAIGIGAMVGRWV
jgi:hypothetical protein